ncbi:hypothetical protein HMPREF1049_0998 [Fusobacterium necrophorum subsp. funduliforme ATCC 51357]|uniref:Uncharacterized protein n=1 Tax=Fusobacterium gonidiaformans 3-1-5R TaxID=469605 RepID=E5BI38_9FUSO|nr:MULTISPECIES: hypothetical protein [Fusobacterium]EFS22161.1 hypothetical protein FSBG_01658 [Fusobacterium gonidiaformans 3-1-5R]EFS22945.1 hypothetical protein FSEG_00552 [Fusobacterium necrophorum D12]EIJ68657.1 hypothetical protein HMPREF1049_0998 [Fusobacterium necrophorum subsp. funduliforme ATCC 51357]
MEGMEKLMKDLGVNNQEELLEYINDPANQEEEIVKQLKEFIDFFAQKNTLQSEN